MARCVARIVPAALVLGALLAPPSLAGGVVDLPRPTVGPGDEDDPAFVMLSCGLAAAGDSTGLITQDGSEMKGAVTGGPWVVVDEMATSVTITCTLQTNSDDPQAEESAEVRRTTRSNTVPGNAAILADAITYTRFPDDEVFVCTHVAWAGRDGVETWEYDGDEARPGVQCNTAVTISG